MFFSFDYLDLYLSLFYIDTKEIIELFLILLQSFFIFFLLFTMLFIMDILKYLAESIQRKSLTILKFLGVHYMTICEKYKEQFFTQDSINNYYIITIECSRLKELSPRIFRLNKIEKKMNFTYFFICRSKYYFNFSKYSESITSLYEVFYNCPGHFFYIQTAYH